MDEHRGHRVRFIAESIWPERAPEAIVEGHRHEALVNIGLEGCDAHVVCPYDTSGLDWMVVSEALRTHPCVVAGGEHRESRLFTDPLTMYAAEGHPLTEPPDRTVAISLTGGLAGVRRDIEQHVARELAKARRPRATCGPALAAGVAERSCSRPPRSRRRRAQRR